MKEVEVDDLNLINNTDEIRAFSTSGSAFYPGLRDIRLELIKNNPSKINQFLYKIQNDDSLIVVSDYGCVKIDNFIFDDYTFIVDNDDDITDTLTVDLTLRHQPIYAKNKEQLLLDII